MVGHFAATENNNFQSAFKVLGCVYALKHQYYVINEKLVFNRLRSNHLPYGGGFIRLGSLKPFWLIDLSILSTAEVSNILFMEINAFSTRYRYFVTPLVISHLIISGLIPEHISTGLWYPSGFTKGRLIKQSV